MKTFRRSAWSAFSYSSILETVYQQIFGARPAGCFVSQGIHAAVHKIQPRILLNLDVTPVKCPVDRFPFQGQSFVEFRSRASQVRSHSRAYQSDKARCLEAGRE